MNFIMIQLLDGRQITSSSVAEKFECSPKTVFRDIEYLRCQIDVPIEWDSRSHSFTLSSEIPWKTGHHHHHHHRRREALAAILEAPVEMIADAA